MSGFKDGVFVIEVEPEDICEYCGKRAETRPYGRNGARICYKCGMENEEETVQNFMLTIASPPSKVNN